MGKRTRVRSKRLDQLDESKLALAIWLITQGEVEDKLTTMPALPTATDDLDEPLEQAA